MHPQEVKGILARIENLAWKVSPVLERAEEKEWIPIANLFEGKSGSKSFVGISQDGYWVLQVDDQIVILTPEKPLICLLPCLESNIEKIKISLFRGLHSHNLPSRLLKSFPFEEIVHSGFFIKSDYWTGLAFGWLEHVEFTPEIADALSEMVEAKWASQKNRHKARWILKKRQQTKE